MGSGCEAVHETVNFLAAQNQKVGVVKVRLYRPFDAGAFVKTLPLTVRSIAVLDRTKEPGSVGEPLYLDCVNALYEQGRSDLRVVGGRYGLSSKEFTPAMIKAVFDNLAEASPKNHFTIGIDDDLSHTSLPSRSQFLHRAGRSCARTVLRARIRRHSGREQGVDQNHRREHGSLRARIFCLRFEESGCDDDLAFALRSAADSLDISHQQGQFRCLSSAVSSPNL